MNIQKNILEYPHPVLLSQSQPVEEMNKEISNILDAMTELMMTNNGIGLAAPQIGISLRLLTVGLNGRFYEVVNPKINWKEGSQTNLEGCLSLPKKIYEVERAEEVVIEGFDRHGKEITLLTNGLLACVFQHEIDHLDGIFINAKGTHIPADQGR